MTKPFVFVLMPFEDSFNDTYKLGIKDAANDAGGYCERVDEQVFEERILDRIYNQINKADVIVADMSGRNPNVFYETGYAHALNKRVILLTNNIDDIPFDLRHHHHIVYKNIVNLKEELSRRLKWYFDNPTKKSISSLSQIDVYINENKLSDDNIYYANANEYSIREGRYFFRFHISYCNISSFVFGTETKFGFEFETEEYLYEQTHPGSFNKFISQNKHSIFITSYYIEPLLPSCWANILVDFIISSSDNLIGQKIPVKFKLYTQAGTQEIKFYLLFREEVEEV